MPTHGSRITPCPHVPSPRQGCRIPGVSGPPSRPSAAQAWQAASDQGPCPVPRSCRPPAHERHNKSDSTHGHGWDNFTSNARVQAFFTGTRKEHLFF